jgi:hypothetical protein
MWVGGQRHALAAFPPGRTRYPLYRKLGGPLGRSGGCRKSCPPPTPGFNPLTVQPVATAKIKVKVSPLLNMTASTEGLEWGERPSPRPSRFSTRKEFRYLLQKTPGGAQGGSRRGSKSEQSKLRRVAIRTTILRTAMRKYRPHKKHFYQ